MSLQESIKASLKEAMLAKDTTRTMVVRGLMSAFTNELVAIGRTPQSELSDDEVLTVIRRAVKQRKDAIEQFSNAGRQDLADSEKAELEILEKYLPQMMSKDEIRTHVDKKKEELGIPAGAEGKAKAGMLVGALMKDLKGKADGGDVKEVVDSSFV